MFEVALMMHSIKYTLFINIIIVHLCSIIVIIFKPCNREESPYFFHLFL